MRPALPDRLAHERAQHLGLTVRLRRFVPAQHLESFLACDRVGNVAEVYARDELFGAHVREELPERFVFGLRIEVPDGIDDGGRSEVDNTLLRSDPPELAVSRDVTPESAHVLCKRLEGPSLDERRERSDRS